MGGGVHGGFGNTQGAREICKIHIDKQNKHIKGTKNYNQQIANGKFPSILIGDPEILLKEGAGTGIMITLHKESVDYKKNIGLYYDETTKKYYKTTKAIIHYDKNQKAHIVPARPNNLNKD